MDPEEASTEYDPAPAPPFTDAYLQRNVHPDAKPTHEKHGENQTLFAKDSEHDETSSSSEDTWMYC